MILFQVSLVHHLKLHIRVFGNYQSYVHIFFQRRRKYNTFDIIMLKHLFFYNFNTFGNKHIFCFSVILNQSIVYDNKLIIIYTHLSCFNFKSISVSNILYTLKVMIVSSNFCICFIVSVICKINIISIMKSYSYTIRKSPFLFHLRIHIILNMFYIG